MSDYEVIVVDDGSTDDGGLLVSARAATDSRIRLIRQENSGEGAARNRGLREATSEWIGLLDADDEWRPGFLETTLAQASSSGSPSAVFTNIVDGSSQRTLLQTSGGGVVPDYFAFVLANGAGMTSSSTLARRAALLECGAFKEGVPAGADLDAWARLAWSGPVAYIPEALALYYPYLPGSATTNARKGDRIFPATVLSYREWSLQSKIPSSLRRSSARMAEHLVLDHVAALINSGQRERAWAVLSEAGWTPHWRIARRLSLLMRLALPSSIWLRMRTQMGRD